MANNESSFKSEFRKALEVQYGALAEIWTSNDMFRCGIPDFNATWEGKYFSVEAKFVTKLPTKGCSKVLKHEVSALQYRHLKRMYTTGCFGIVLIGMSDIAVAVPVLDMTPNSLEPGSAANISLQNLHDMRDSGLGFIKSKGHWQVKGFFEKIASVI